MSTVGALADLNPIHLVRSPSFPSLLSTARSPTPVPPPVRARRKIAEPPDGLNRSYARFIAPCDRADFEAAKGLIRDIVPMMLDLSCSWTRQQPDHVDELFSTILTAFPTFNGYMNIWPIAYYAYQHVSLLRSQSKRRGGTAGRIIGAASSFQPLPTVPTKTGDAECHRATNGTRSHRSSSPNSNPSSSDLPHQHNGDKNIQEFLLAADTGLQHLVERFQRAGINSRARLITMAQWSGDVRDSFLRTELGLDAFEWRVISNKLDTLLGNEM